MIQRVQTLWMILAAIAVFLTIKFSFYSGTLIMENVTNPATVLTPDGSYHVLTAVDSFLILILTSALGTGIIINIFSMFNNLALTSAGAPYRTSSFQLFSY